jgi:putative nucleotidyltransferase with HDIG domain
MTEPLQADQVPVSPSDLARFWPLDGLKPDELSTVARHTAMQRSPAGACIVKIGSDENLALYLETGKVSLVGYDKREVVVDSESNLGRFPISNLRPHRYSVTALSDAILLKIDKTVLGQVINKGENLSHHIEIPLSPTELSDYSLFEQIQHDIVEERVEIPTMPNVAFQIYRVISQDNSDARKVARIVESDPAIAAKLVRTANSVFYRRQKGVESCSEAIVRLGMLAVKNLVTSFVMRELYQSKLPAIQAQVSKLWKHSAIVGAISYNLARLTPGMNPETALLAGLLHDIGALCVLGYAEKNPAALYDNEKFAHVIATFRGQLGAEILRQWNFPASVVNAARDAEDWHRDPDPKPDYSDLVLIAQLHSFAGNERMWSMPRIYEVPAFKKMVSGQLSPTLSLSILDDAKQHIDETARWLTLQ